MAKYCSRSYSRITGISNDMATRNSSKTVLLSDDCRPCLGLDLSPYTIMQLKSGIRTSRLVLSRHPEILSGVKLDSSVKSTDFRGEATTVSDLGVPSSVPFDTFKYKFY
ncbi:hypothetical protein TNCV_1268771 [Trichonephila clavipes]|nr:hypothetical protein TNCV_1268771 [Trichonephila clavipes]